LKRIRTLTKKTKIENRKIESERARREAGEESLFNPKLWERGKRASPTTEVRERVQAGLLKSPRIKTLLLRQCAGVSHQRPGNPHPNPLPGQGEGIHQVLAW
jgi:hypothetical protein